jgi:two-component system sensor histidine kinase KdpD
MRLDFTISGYPLTFVTMLSVSLITCTLTTNLKREERMRMENERERMRANLLRAISHDLRTPLTGISGAVNVVLDNPELPRQQERELLAGVRDDANWLIRMVENLLSVTRIGLDEAQIEKSVEPAEEVIFAAIAKFRKRYPDVEVIAKVPEDVVFVPMDPVLVEQVLSNLMENAAIHGEATTVWLKLEVKREMAEFSVKDNGVGISPTVLPHLYDDYYMLAEKSRGTGKRHSMGIGLSVCKSIVKAHSGTVNAYNHAEGGACFSFSLPIYREKENNGNS